MNRWLMLRRLRGPAFILLGGIMALLDQWHIIGWGRSWPLFLILAGLLSLAERAALSQADSEGYDQNHPGGYAYHPGGGPSGTSIVPNVVPGPAPDSSIPSDPSERRQ